jgi:hypothetical protein
MVLCRRSHGWLPSSHRISLTPHPTSYLYIYALRAFPERLTTHPYSAYTKCTESEQSAASLAARFAPQIQLVRQTKGRFPAHFWQGCIKSDLSAAMGTVIIILRTLMAPRGCACPRKAARFISAPIQRFAQLSSTNAARERSQVCCCLHLCKCSLRYLPTMLRQDELPAAVLARTGALCSRILRAYYMANQVRARPSSASPFPTPDANQA